MNYLSLFSGMGGFDAAFDRAGMTGVGQCELDPHAAAVVAHHWPDVPRWTDVRTLKGEDVGPIGTVDLVAGGFPCQDLSVAGKRAGLAGERSGLFYEMARIIAECAPRWLLLENVPGLLSSNKGRDFAAVLGTLVGTGLTVPRDGWRNSGVAWGPFYGVAWRVMDSQYFGVPQRRRRVFIVGCLGDAARAGAVLFESESCGGDTPPRRTPGERVADALTVGANQYSGFPGEPVIGVPDPAYADSVGQQRVGRDAQDTFVIQDATMHREKQQNGMGVAEGGPMYTLDGKGTHAVAYHENMSGNVATAGTARALRSGASKSYQGVVTGMTVRRLTPVECLRLQGFPDDWFDGLSLSDSAKYRLCGNAVTVSVVQWIAERIMQCA